MDQSPSDQDSQKQERTVSPASLYRDEKQAIIKQGASNYPVSSTLRKHSSGYVRDVVPVLRILISNFTIFGAFQLVGKLSLDIMRLTADGLIKRYNFVGEILNFTDFIVLAGALFYFIFVSYLDLVSQYKISRAIEKRVEQDEGDSNE